MLICLATYNGATWLPPQLDSLLTQDDEDWRLLVSDDGSDDATGEILQEYLRKDSRIVLLPTRSGPRGPSANFEYLLGQVQQQCRVDSELVALCDQDDVWRSDKLSLSRQMLDRHLGCCSDLALTHADGSLSGQRLLRQLASNGQVSVSSLLAQNTAVGCTLAFRSSVLELALPFPESLMNHDWWLALCISVAGGLGLIDEPLVQYRQHANNSIGAYRPAQQIAKSRTLLLRQHRVLRSQYEAVEILRGRLVERHQAVPEILDDYLRVLGDSSTRRRVTGLLSGAFAAPHKPLRILRSLAAVRSFR